MITRQQARAETRAAVKAALAKETGHGTKVGPGRRNKWLQRHPKLAPFYGMAFAVLSTGGTPPRWHAIRRMMVALAQSPRVRIGGIKDPVPYLLHLGRHQRGSWRSFPHVTIDANLQVQP